MPKGPWPLSVKFWKHVERSEGCWIWHGQRARNGYGRVRTLIGGRRQSTAAHRVSWELNRGPIPDGLFALHRCDVRECVNPDHLFLGTKQDNTLDMWRKGRGRVYTGPRHRGERAGTARLREPQVRWIRRMCSRGMSQSDVAWLAGVCQAQVWRIVHGLEWAHDGKVA